MHLAIPQNSLKGKEFYCDVDGKAVASSIVFVWLVNKGRRV